MNWSTLVSVFWLACILTGISLVVAIFQIRTAVQETTATLDEVRQLLAEIRDKMD